MRKLAGFPRREESPYDAFDTGQFGEHRAEEDESQNEDVLRNALFHPFEEPSCYDREQEDDDAAEQEDGDAELGPKVGVYLARGHSHDDGQYEKRKCVGDDGASDGYRDRPVLRDTVFADDGVGDERMRCEHAREQYRRFRREIESVKARDDTQDHGYQKGVHAEQQTFGTVAAEVAEVYFEAREEHDVEQAGRTGEDDAAVAFHKVDAVRAYDCTGDYQSKDGRYADFVQEQRCEQDYRQDDEEFQYRVCQRQRYVEYVQRKHRQVHDITLPS